MKRQRKKISKIDTKIIKLLEQRFELSEEIGKYKRKNNIDIYDPKREEEIISQYSKLTSDENRNAIIKVIKLIIKQSRIKQRK